MVKRANHYEAAFEAYLRAERLPYVAVDEAKRSRFSDGSLKSLDFIVSRDETRSLIAHGCEELPIRYDDPAVGDGAMGEQAAGDGEATAPPDRPTSWLVDVKGRRFPSGTQRQYWKNWSTRDDLVSLTRWQQLFGQSSAALFVFAYNVCGDRSPLPAEQLFEFRGHWYGFVGIELSQYVRWARPISEAWGTLAMPSKVFRELAAPLDRFF